MFVHLSVCWLVVVSLFNILHMVYSVFPPSFVNYWCRGIIYRFPVEPMVQI